MIRRTVLLLPLVLAVTWGTAARSQSPAGDLAILDPWSRATPGGARVGAGYLVVENRGTDADRLLGVEAEVATAGELHETIEEAGVARMRPTGPVAIPGGGRLELKPGGRHLMLTGLKRPLKEGERFAATLVFERAGRVPVTFAVRGIGAGAASHGHP